MNYFGDKMDFLTFDEAKYLNQTKYLVNGSKFYIYSIIHSENKKVYQCNLCGINNINSSLDVHSQSVLHKELSKLETFPYKVWMKNSLISDNNTICDPSENLKSMVSSMYGKKSEHPKSNKELPRGYKNVSSNNYSHEGNSKHTDIDLSRLISTEISQRCHSVRNDENKIPTFLSMCRNIKVLEDFLDEGLRKDIRKLFLKSIELERQSVGSSNKLVSMENLQIIFKIKASLSDKLDTLPCKFLRVVNLFYDELLYFTDLYSIQRKNAKKIQMMMES